MMPQSTADDPGSGSMQDSKPDESSQAEATETLSSAMDWGLRTLCGEDASAACRLLLADATGWGSAQLFAFPERRVRPEAWARFRESVLRHASGEPLAYVRGRRGFWTLDLEVTPDTLIPRPETELLVELATRRLPAAPSRVLDLGTGSGAIALAIASERPDCTVVAVDASRAALEVASRNAVRHGLTVQCCQSDWYDAVPDGTWDLIVSNPPYIAGSDPHLVQGDLPSEPRAALASGADGLDALRVIVPGSRGRLCPGGWLLVEHGWDQGPAVRALFEAAGLVEVSTERDLEQRDRVTQGRQPSG